MLSHLILMRHAKSSWPGDIPSDHDRPLTDGGKVTTEAVGRVLVARNYAPDTIWSSDSVRTRQTAMCLIRAIEGAQTVLYNSRLYHASAEEMLSICQEEDEPKGNLMILGHNPGMSGFHEYLTTQSYPYSPASCAVLSRQNNQGSNWLTPKAWRLIDIINPKELGL